MQTPSNLSTRDPGQRVADGLASKHAGLAKAVQLGAAVLDEMPTDPMPSVPAAASKVPAVEWADQREELNFILRATSNPRFLQLLTKFHERLRSYTIQNPDAALCALIYLSGKENTFYSASHAMLVSVICGIAARDVLGWSEQHEKTLTLAALSMNVGMTDLQDVLSKQSLPITAEQREMIKGHPLRSVSILKSAGVVDHDLLEAVRMHHDAPPGDLKGRASMTEKLARIIQRADTFAARRAPRVSRAASTPAEANQAAYFDELGSVDEAGTVIIKTVGIYAPGTIVRLATNEMAIVVRRGRNTAKPLAMSLTTSDGVMRAHYELRDTNRNECRIVSTIDPAECRFVINMRKVMKYSS